MMHGSLLLLLLVGLGLLILGMPRVGLWPRYRAWREARRRQRHEDALKHILERALDNRKPTLASLAQALGLSLEEARELVRALVQRGWVRIGGQGRLDLSESGRARALNLLRAHRLWERYLTDEAHWPLRDVHHAAHEHEHRLNPDDVARLAARLGFPATDPHGDPIPDERGRVPRRDSIPLTQWPVGTVGRIVHLEDEPPNLLDQLLDLGLQLGMQVEVMDRFPRGVVLRTPNGVVQVEHRLAENVCLAPIHEEPASPTEDEGAVPLSEWPEGQEAEIVRLDEHLQGLTRRRLLDLGFTPGARVTPVLKPVFQDPRAYRIRGTLIALRRDQAQHIWVRPVSSTPVPASSETKAEPTTTARRPG
ncbi:MAG: metal-dependent transcriptional regulator [Chloroflexi bacterium]|nr:metal-dependent transcriptional regulator [Chloroflexota bacterium]